jgi:hypothetical protein
MLRSSFRKEIDDVVYEIDCAMMKVGSGNDIDIGQSLISRSFPFI